ncbi:hypothetical protein [Burkholderia guangdongensis]|uniref:hypothetical protein n=1 Tax=Burkholderia guangdongensis TaxID=1792500 RepID=UPI0015CE5059|nr:hypothetical protein [Burkholderia guangdongensis]
MREDEVGDDDADMPGGSTVMLGCGLFVVGLPCWWVVASMLDSLRAHPIIPAVWPRYVGVIGLFIPLLFGMAWKYDANRARHIPWLVVGWVAGGILVGLLAKCALIIVPPAG